MNIPLFVKKPVPVPLNWDKVLCKDDVFWILKVGPDWVAIPENRDIPVRRGQTLEEIFESDEFSIFRQKAFESYTQIWDSKPKLNVTDPLKTGMKVQYKKLVCLVVRDLEDRFCLVNLETGVAFRRSESIIGLFTIFPSENWELVQD